ncbi:MAG: hypothetical protein IJQ52_00295 [Bacteroidales bacterium]|nr:hypothetical protein [Bacteroidales bacterium]
MKKIVVSLLLAISFTIAYSQPKIVGHRGCRFDGPYENTLESLRFAYSVGVDVVEFDVQLTADNEVVVFHGPIVPGPDKDIRTLSFAEARSVVLPGGHQMPVLREWLAETKNHPATQLVIEIKKQLSDEKTLLLARKTLDEASAAGISPGYTSFSTLALDEIHRLSPSSKLIYLQSGTPVMTAAWAAEKGYKGLSYNLDGFMNNPSVISEAKALGIETTLWLVNDKEVADWAVRHGVDYVSSDHPEKLVEWLHPLPKNAGLRTEWADKVNPLAPLPEYPRPQMVRAEWRNLNGEWDYAIRGNDEGYGSPDGKILVPFAVESALSGVQKHVGPDNALWYSRSFTVPRAWKGKKLILHFGAADWQAEVWVNGQKAGMHTGGYSPFSLDITSLVKKSGAQDLKVKVTDASDQSWQPRGKQCDRPQGIWYTPVTGIWQTVWMEAVPEAHITSYYAQSDIDNACIKVNIDTEGLKAGDMVNVKLREGGIGYSAEVPSGAVLAEGNGSEVVLKVPEMKLWSPTQPYLYGLEITVVRGGKVVDKVEGYTAMRKISVIMDKDTFHARKGVPQGSLRLGLNNDILFQFGPLDQGWWPDGLYTAPTDEALKFDILKTKEWGFNMIRKHIKVEPARWYYWCDALGVLVWQDMPCIADHNKKNNAIRPKDIAAAQANFWAKDSFIGGTDCDVPYYWKQNYYKEWGEIIDNLKGFPCIVVWVPFNEAWGQFDTKEVVKFTKEKDPSRLVNESSGGNFHFAGDILDAHHYPEPKLNVFERTMVNVIGEYGGIGYPLKGHIWLPEGKNWGYAGLCKSTEEVIERYKLYADRLKVLISTGCAAAVYTQTTDVEVEVNGLMTYDRIEKVDAQLFRSINEDVIATPSWRQ